MQNRLFQMLTLLGAMVMTVSVLIAVFVFPAEDGGLNLPLLYTGIGVGTLIDLVAVVVLIQSRRNS